MKTHEHRTATLVASRVNNANYGTVSEYWQLMDSIWYVIADHKFHDLLCPHLDLLDLADLGDVLQ